MGEKKPGEEDTITDIFLTTEIISTSSKEHFIT